MERIKSQINQINIVSAACVHRFSTLDRHYQRCVWLYTAYRDVEKGAGIHPERKEAPPAEYRRWRRGTKQVEEDEAVRRLKDKL